MREIKFRGWSGAQEKWVYGLPYFSPGTGIWSIVYPNGWQPTYNNPDEGESNVFTNVDAKTIGEFAGLKDKNGKEIYEEDICVLHLPNTWGDDGELSKEVENKIVTISWKNNGFVLLGWGVNGYFNIQGTPYFGTFKSEHFEIIGNIHENPEL